MDSTFETAWSISPHVQLFHCCAEGALSIVAPENIVENETVIRKTKSEATLSPRNEKIK